MEEVRNFEVDHSVEDGIIDEAERLYQQGEYAKAISYAESKMQTIKNAAYASDSHDKKYQFSNEYEAFFYSKLIKSSFVIQEDYEYRLVELIVDCYYKLNKYNKGLPWIEKGLSLVPNDKNMLNFKIQYSKRMGALNELKATLDRYVTFAWRKEDLFSIMFNYGYYYIEVKKYDLARDYLLMAKYYDITDDARNLVKNELDYISSILNDNFVEDVEAAFNSLKSKNLPMAISDAAQEVLLQMYTAYLNESVETPQEDLDYLRENIIVLTFGQEWLVKLIESLVFRDAKYYQTRDFSYEVNRRWEELGAFSDELLPKSGAKFVASYFKEGTVGGKFIIYSFSRDAIKETQDEFNETMKEYAVELEKKPIEVDEEDELGEDEDDYEDINDGEDILNDVNKIVETVKDLSDVETDIITLEKSLEILKEGIQEVVSEEEFVSTSNIDAKKITSKAGEDNLEINYVFKFATDKFGAIKTIVENKEPAINNICKVIESVINSWEYKN